MFDSFAFGFKLIKHDLFKKIYRNNSEKLALKVREQSTLISALTNEKESLQNENESLRQHIKTFNQSLDFTTTSKEKLKALQAHLNQQQNVLLQLQAKLKENE